MYLRKIREEATPGCRRQIIRHRHGNPWEPVSILDIDENGVLTEELGLIPQADIHDMMGEWKPPVDGMVQCNMPHDDEALIWSRKGSWDMHETPIDCGHWFATREEREAHQTELHSVYIKWNEGMRSQARLNPGPVGQTELIPEHESGGTPTSNGTPDGPTEKQLAFIASLAEAKEVEANECKTKAAATAEIDRLKALPDAQPFRRNKFDAPCSECGNIVEAGTGALRKVDGAWLVGHSDGCPEESNLPPAVPDGYYAVDNSDGDTAFYRVKNGRKPGVVFIDTVIGGGFGNRLVREPLPAKNREAVLTKIVEAGFDEAAARFGRELVMCGRCGRHLTDEVSRELGIGPTCRKA